MKDESKAASEPTDKQQNGSQVRGLYVGNTVVQEL
jgi:hypothetical protein